MWKIGLNDRKLAPMLSHHAVYGSGTIIPSSWRTNISQVNVKTFDQTSIFYFRGCTDDCGFSGRPPRYWITSEHCYMFAKACPIHAITYPIFIGKDLELYGLHFFKCIPPNKFNDDKHLRIHWSKDQWNFVGLAMNCDILLAEYAIFSQVVAIYYIKPIFWRKQVASSSFKKLLCCASQV